MGGDLLGERVDVPGREPFAAAIARELPPARILDQRRAGDRARGRDEDLVQATALDHQPLESLVHLGAALEHVVLLVYESRGRSLGDRDERHLVRDLEQRQLELVGLGEDRFRHPLVVEADPEAESGETLGG